MAQVTLYLDEATAAKMRLAAKDAGLSMSRWLGEVIERETAEHWPKAVRELAGQWPDFPTAEELRQDEGEDLPREPL
ncbi:MAG: CopG family transcriptional regulator [Deltaproteobacteria bacterium RIFOXYA12_FULL_58_15]|nr:MAG: CopG family transcriptional regulator [Deltaproteobacteria bacterium RIFOXYA12_FULL_58_15]OGR12226.1 MAG: CopG family transcriptional regulator [Deltaproteobacteria bacterium RIFOXYB12_FULL_58_9]